MQLKYDLNAEKFLTNILVITNKAVDHSKKESQCVEHHTYRILPR